MYDIWLLGILKIDFNKELYGLKKTTKVTEYLI